MSPFKRSAPSLVLLAFACASVFGGQAKPLTLEEALRLARQNNGTVKSAYLTFQAATASTRAANGEFLPTVTPGATQEFSRTERYTGPLRGRTNVDDLTTQVQAAWRIFDSGDRKLSLEQARLNQDATGHTALQTLRRTLFDVQTRFFEALRRQELLKVQDRQVERTKVIFEQTKFRASDEIGDAPRKDTKQAEADLLNSQVSQLQARTRISTALADLKATLGVGPEPLPPLQEPPQSEFKPLPFSLEEAVKEGLASRSDLAAERTRVEASRTRVKVAELDKGPRWSVDANYRRTFSEAPLENSSLSFNITYPLFDGARSKEQVAAQKLNLQASLASLTQSERDARAEIEAAYTEYEQNLLRLTAAGKALEAAQENYRSAVESQKEGAASVIEVLTAQVTLTTSESNLVEARYDAILSEVRLRLVLGREMPGEKD